MWIVCPLSHTKNEIWKVGASGRRRWFYLDPAVVKWRDAQRIRWAEEGLFWWGGHCEVDMHFHLPPSADGHWWDIDHGISNLLDTMTGVAYPDDSLVTQVVATRTYDAPQGEAYVDIFLFPAVL